MTWLNKLPGLKTSPAGLEFTLWRKLPRFLFFGTALPFLLVGLLHLTSPDPLTPFQERSLLLAEYVALGTVLLHWTLVLTAGIACAIVILMKGPAYVADAYELNDSDHPL